MGGQKQLNSESNIGAAPVKKRGRPKKNLDSEAENTMSQLDLIESLPPKKRWRPKKSGSSIISSSKQKFS